MLDPQDEAYDRRLAHHLVSLYYQSEEQIEEEYLDMAVLRDYIAYARTCIKPRLSEEAGQALIEVCFSTNVTKAFCHCQCFPSSCDAHLPLGLRGHEEDWQRSWHGVCLSQAAGVLDPSGGGPLQSSLL